MNNPVFLKLSDDKFININNILYLEKNWQPVDVYDCYMNGRDQPFILSKLEFEHIKGYLNNICVVPHIYEKVNNDD